MGNFSEEVGFAERRVEQMDREKRDQEMRKRKKASGCLSWPLATSLHYLEGSVLFASVFPISLLYLS